MIEYSYFILPMNSTPTFGEVKAQIENLFIENQIKELALSIYLSDNYCSFSSRRVDLQTDFIWSNPEVESILFKINGEKQKITNIFEFDCDYLIHHIDVEDIAIESGLLEQEQIDLIKDSDYFFYRCRSTIDISKEKVSALKLASIIYAIGYLTNGMIFSVNDWDIQLPPQIMSATKSKKNL